MTSNMSESTNNEKARDGSWLNTVDTIIGIITNQIDNQRMAIQGKDGVVERGKALLMERWENCVGYKIMQVQEGGNKFSILHRQVNLPIFFVNDIL